MRKKYDLADRDIGANGILREGAAAHEVVQLLAVAGEARGAVRHDALALRRPAFIDFFKSIKIFLIY